MQIKHNNVRMPLQQIATYWEHFSPLCFPLSSRECARFASPTHWVYFSFRMLPPPSPPFFFFFLQWQANALGINITHHSGAAGFSKLFLSGDSLEHRPRDLPQTWISSSPRTSGTYGRTSRTWMRMRTLSCTWGQPSHCLRAPRPLPFAAASSLWTSLASARQLY